MDDEEVYHFLEKRDGAPENYTVNLGLGPNGQPQIIILVSWMYPKGRMDKLLLMLRESISDTRWVIDNINYVSAVYIDTGDPEVVLAWVSKSSRL